MAKKRESFIKPYVVTDGDDFRLKKHDPADKGSMKKEAAKALLAGRESRGWPRCRSGCTPRTDGACC